MCFYVKIRIQTKDPAFLQDPLSCQSVAVSEIRSQAYHAVYTAGEVACIFIILLVEQIVALENLEATEEDIAEAMAVIARQNRLTLEQMKPYMDAEFEAAVVRNVLFRYAKDFSATTWS